MIVVHVSIRMKPECVDAFRIATLENARNSVMEPGVVRFDVVQQAYDATRPLFPDPADWDISQHTLEEPA